MRTTVNEQVKNVCDSCVLPTFTVKRLRERTACSVHKCKRFHKPFYQRLHTVCVRKTPPKRFLLPTIVICYKFGGYYGMEVVFVELKWLASVLPPIEELPNDHPKVDLVMAEAVLHKFTKSPSFYRRHSSAPVRRRGSRTGKGNPSSKPSDEDASDIPGNDFESRVTSIH